MLNVLGFRVGGDPSAVVPTIDGTSLVELVADFEQRSGFRPAGGYDGLDPALCGPGRRGGWGSERGGDPWPAPGHLWLLGCDCGEAGCWPLAAEVHARPGQVTWSRFGQPHRPDWSYDGFGPFTFDADQYAAAVAELTETLARRRR